MCLAMSITLYHFLDDIVYYFSPILENDTIRSKLVEFTSRFLKKLGCTSKVL